MLKKITFYYLASVLLVSTIHAGEADAFDLYDWMESLNGEWTLSPAEKQTGTDSYKHKAVLPLVGTDATGIAFKSIGRNSTIQEDLLPNTAKQMVTMYHCKDLECEQIKATHYCVKMNQPEFIANLAASTKNRIVFDCDMSTELCLSDEDHVHQIIHEISDKGTHLKTSYLSWENQKPKENSSIYHFDKKNKKNF
ncbi:hypothetical protein KJ877_04940 [bacterium]|nr:hypothetical protein [bacterium]MBU1990432.1 hypothetical protein [bacterium]